MSAADVQGRGRISRNTSQLTSAHFLVYPNADDSPDLLADGPGGATGCKDIRVMGAIAEGATEVLVVQRLDGVEVPIPVPWLAVGLPLGIQARRLLPHTVTAVRHTGTGPAGVTFTGTPAADYEMVVEITTSGALNVGQFRWSSDGGATWTESGVTLPAGGTDALGSTGLTANFPAGSYVDNDLYRAESFVTTAENILVQW